MRILRAIASLDPAGGGPVEGLVRSNAELAARGHAVEVASLDAPAAGSAHPFAHHRLGPARNRYGYAPALAPWVRANARRFDVGVLHGLWNYSQFGAWRGLRGTGLPYVVFSHGMLDPWFNRVQPVKRWAKQAYWLAVQGRILADAAAVLFTTEEERRLARTAFFGHGYRERVVAYGAASPPETGEAQPQALHVAIPALGHRRFLLFMSRLHQKKGCDLLLQAFAQVAGRAGCDLVIAGPEADGHGAALRALADRLGIAARVHWPGMLSGEAKWGALCAAEALVLPSHGENFGIVVAEALAAGTPVLISDRVNIWREVEAAGAGFVAPDTLAGTSMVLTRFLALPAADRHAMRQRARDCHRRHFSLPAAADALEQVLAEAARQQ